MTKAVKFPLADIEVSLLSHIWLLTTFRDKQLCYVPKFCNFYLPILPFKCITERHRHVKDALYIFTVLHYSST